MSEPIRYQRLDKTCPPSVFDELAEIHREEIDQGFLSAIGARFLRRLYRALADSPHGFVIAARHEDRVVGFICGSTNTAKVYRDYLIRWGVFSMAVLLPKLLTLSRIRGLLETLFYPSRKENKAFPAPEILNFCVTNSWQGKGVGRRLFSELIDEFRSRGVQTIKIITGTSQHKAQRFYESSNASKAGEIHIHDGVPSIVYTYQIPVTRHGDASS